MAGRLLADLRSALRRRARRARYAVEDLGYSLRRLTRRVSSAIGRSWSGLTIRTRNRTLGVLAAALAIAVVVALAVPNLPCQAPGGSECQPDDDAIALVPGDSSAYVHVITDPGTEQYERAASIWSRLPALTDQVVARLPAPSGARIDYGRDVASWLGGEAALALVPAAGDAPRPTALLEIGDQDRAALFMEQLTGGGAETEEHRGVDIVVDGGAAVAAVAGFVVVGKEAQVRRMIDTDAGGPALADAEWVDEVRDRFPDPRLAELLVSEQGAEELFASRGPLGSFDVFVNSSASRGAGAALVATEDALELDIESLLDSDRAESAPGFFAAFPDFEPALADEPSEDALAYLVLGDPARSVADLVTQATAGSPGLAAGFEHFATRLRKAGDLSLEQDLLPLLSSQAAVWLEPHRDSGAAGGPEAELPGPEGAPPAVTPGVGAPFVTMLVDEVDPERATEALASLQRPIARALDPGRNLQAPVFEQRRIDGAQAQGLRVSPAVELTYAVLDGRLAISTDPAGVTQVLRSDPSLEESGRYQDATEGLPDEVSAFAYLNLNGLLQFAEQAGLGADPAYASFGEELARLEALGVAVQQGDGEIDTEVRLSVGE